MVGVVWSIGVVNAMGKLIHSDFLFARPSFASGVGSALDMWGQLHADYNESGSPGEADANAIYSDWAIVGQDISDAMEECASECEAA